MKNSARDHYISAENLCSVRNIEYRDMCTHISCTYMTVTHSRHVARFVGVSIALTLVHSVEIYPESTTKHHFIQF